MNGSTITLIVTLVLAAIALYGAFVGIRSREVAKTAIDQLTLVSAALDFERGERQREKVHCDEQVAELRGRVDDLTNGWLDRLAPQAAAAMAPHIAESLRAPIVQILREALR